MKNYSFDFDLGLASTPLEEELCDLPSPDQTCTVCCSARFPEVSLHLAKKVVFFDQDDEGLLIRCSDGTRYRGEILVGADSAYFSIRENLFEFLNCRGKLPASDKAPLAFGSFSLVGRTRVLNPDEFPMLKSELSEISSILGDTNMCTVS